VLLFLGGAGMTAIMYFFMEEAGEVMTATTEAWVFSECASGEGGCCNGLKSNCDRPINEVSFATIHTSMSNAEDMWMGPNNRLPHYGALESGYRGLMVDLYMHDGDFDQDTPKTLYACHGLCAFGKRTAEAEFNHTAVWLDRNPNEVVQIFFENPDGFASDHEIYKEFEK
jgi:hypothetical protein